MKLFCTECGVAFSGEGNFCSRCGAPRGDAPTRVPSAEPRSQTPIEVLGIKPPLAKVRISETLDDSNFNIKNYYSPEEIEYFSQILDQILDVYDVHGIEHVRQALIQLGDAGSSAAWRALALIAAQNADPENMKKYFWLGVHCASNNWDVLLTTTIAAKDLAREIDAEKSDTNWVFQSPHPLSEDVAGVSDLLCEVIGVLYPDSDELGSYMAEGAETTRRMLADAGRALYQIHQVFGRDGRPPGHIGLMAMGLVLLIDFGPADQRVGVELTLKNLVTIQGQFADFARQLLEIEITKPKLVELGVWRWS